MDIENTVTENKFFPPNSTERDGVPFTRIFGNRIYIDQTVYEYMLEFLLVYVSGKKVGEDSYEEMRFHRADDNLNTYHIRNRMGLKRVILFEKSKIEKEIKVDADAYKYALKVFAESIGDDTGELVRIIQDFLFGYAIGSSNRSWSAKALLPIAPELIFTAAMPDIKERSKLIFSEEDKNIECDTKFDFAQHNFMARGGEVFYCHIVQGLMKYDDEDNTYRKKLEFYINNMLTANSKKLSKLLGQFQEAWENAIGMTDNSTRYKACRIGMIPEDRYTSFEEDTIVELITFLSNEIHAIERIELLSIGVMVQVYRMMMKGLYNYFNGKKQIVAIIDMKPEKGKNIIRSASERSFLNLEEAFAEAYNIENQMSSNPVEYKDQQNHKKKYGFAVIKKTGKNMGFVIPKKGNHERFTFTEEMVKFFVLCMIRPGNKMTVADFAEKIYRKYNMIIGPVQYRDYLNNNGKIEEQIDAFDENYKMFQAYLKNAGFLRELSDATSIVVNPYGEIEYRNE